MSSAVSSDNEPLQQQLHPENNISVDNSSENLTDKEELLSFHSKGERSGGGEVEENVNDEFGGVTACLASSLTKNAHTSINSMRPDDDDMEFTTAEDNDDPTDDPDTLMIGGGLVEMFEETDLDTDADNKLQLYSDADAAVESDALVDTPAASNSNDKSLKKVKRKTKVHTFREASRLSLEERIKCIRMCSRYGSYADAQKAWRQTYDTEPPCRKTISTIDKKFQKTGSVGRPKSTRTEAVIARVEEAVSKDPNKSIRTLSKELGINSASVHRIRKEFEDKRNTLKMENRKLRDRLNEALKRIVLLEKRLTRNQAGAQADVSTAAILPNGAMEPKYETLVITSPEGFTSDHIDGQNGSNIPTLIALNNSNNQVLRLPVGVGQETIHIITLPQGSSSHQHILSLDDSSSFQLSIPSTSPSCHQQANNISTTSFLTSTSSTLSSNQDPGTSSFVSFK